MELIGLNIMPSVKQVWHHLENTTISIRKVRFFFRPASRAGDKMLGTKVLLLWLKSETEAVSVFFGPGSGLTRPRAAQNLWGVTNILHTPSFYKVVTVSSGLKYISEQMKLSI